MRTMWTAVELCLVDTPFLQLRQRKNVEARKRARIL